MRTPLFLSLACMVSLAGCSTPTPAPAPAVTALPAPRAAPSEAGLGRVMGRDAAALLAGFGQPAQDVREGPARKLQFRGPACVLDAYLYPPAGGTGPAIVTWIDARTPQGGDLDRASCIAALIRR